MAPPLPRARTSRSRLPSWRPPREIAADAADSFLDALERVGVGEAQVSLGAGAKVHPWRYAHVGMLEDIEGKGLGVGAEAAGVGQHVEGARGGYRHAQADPPQPRHHDPPPLVEDLTEAQGVV